MADLTYLYPVDHEPSPAEVRSDQVIVDIEFTSEDEVTVVHGLNLPRGIDPVVTITPTGRDSLSWCSAFGTNDVHIQSNGAGSARVYISRP